MNKEEYKKLISKHQPKEKKFQNFIVAFLVGGLLAVVCELLSNLYIDIFNVSKVISYSIVCLTLIFVTALCTGLGFFDNLVEKFKCGLIIPTTGFAHSVTSSALEYRKDGLVTGLGSNFFKLAGSVILYGILSAFLFCILGVIIYG